jgi:polyisoprenoid-binding protein YceI
VPVSSHRSSTTILPSWTLTAAAAASLLVAGATTASAQTEVYLVDEGESRVRVHLGRAGLLGFLGHDHTIEAPVSEGWIEVEPGAPAESRVDLKWKAADLVVVPGTEPAEDIPEVEERMRGPDVLDVERYPGIRFWSFEIRPEESEPGRWRLQVKGGLEIKGSRHTVELPLEVRREGDEIVASGEVELQLERLGIEPPSVAGVVNVDNDFRVSFEVRARPKGTGARDDGGEDSRPR